MHAAVSALLHIWSLCHILPLASPISPAKSKPAKKPSLSAALQHGCPSSAPPYLIVAASHQLLLPFLPCSVPASRLVLKAKPFSCPAARHHVMAQLAAAGVAAWRVDLLPLTAGTGEHLSVYGLMDISLDPFPYAGTTTTMESLFMGVPVITLAGGCHAHNVSCSLLSAVGLAQQWVARDADQYVALAVRHAADVATLQQLRQGLRQQMLSSPMCDWQPFVASLEDAYEVMWQRWVQEGGRKRQIAGVQQPQDAVTLKQQQQQLAVRLVVDASLSAAAAAAGPPALAVTIAARPAAAAAAAAPVVTENQAAGTTAAAAGAQQMPDCSMPGDGAGSRGDQNCGSKKGSSRGMWGLGAELCAAAPAAGAVVAETVHAAAAGEGGSSSSAHKGRKISSSCDAAATMHAGTAGDVRGL
jgi:hypothetical protein